MRTLACFIALLIVTGCTDQYSDIRALARSEAINRKDLVGSGDCRIVNTLAAVSMSGGAKIVYGTIRNADGEYRHLWAETAKGEIVDRSCPPSLPQCRKRGYRAIVSVDSMQVVWTAPGDESWRESHAYTTEFVKTVRGAK